MQEKQWLRIYNTDKYISYKSNEPWQSFRVPTPVGEVDESFTMGDYWLIILYMAYQKSWELLRDATKHIESSTIKRKKIDELEKKLKKMGYYEAPEKLLMLSNSTSDINVDEATNWFFNGIDY